jgi:two-component system, OmpR family, sensor histidine kinase CiaH
VFSRARIRLTAWFVAALATFLVVLGGVVYVVVQEQLKTQVNNGVRAAALRASGDVKSTYKNTGTIDTRSNTYWTELAQDSIYKIDLVQFPQLEGLIGQGAQRVGLPNLGAALAAYDRGHDVRTIQTPSGSVRVYSLAVTSNGGQVLAVVQAARSTVPEDQSLNKLLIVLLIGGGISLLLGALGAWWLAGKALTPVQEAFGRQQAFVADASHELRTPLTVIKANAEYLQLTDPDSDEIADIVSETDRLSALVDSLLSLARGERGDRPISDVFDVGQVATQTVEAMIPLADERQIQLRVDATPGLRIAGDREQIRQLLVILVDNALRYTPPGGSVAVMVTRSGGDALVQVRDTGIGIAREAHDRVWERFYRGDEARNRDSGGAGLGLAIAKQLVEDHEGRVGLESVPGEGSTFSVRLPLAKAQ